MVETQELVARSYSSAPKYTEAKAGLPEDYTEIKTVRDLLEINYKLVQAKEQLRRNIIALMKSGGKKYPEILGYDDDVVPALDRAILSHHDVFLIGQIGQAKTKIVETIAKNLLSPIPIIDGSITNDCPMDLPEADLASLLEGQEPSNASPRFHISPESSQKILDNKLDTKITWVGGLHRFRYVLATPDISVKDLVGYIDAIKVAKKGVEMYKIDSYSPGQLLQAKHGIFCIDELPVLDPRKQVALLSVLQEGRYTTGSYPVVFEPKIAFFATANPIDYTHSGKIIEPLYDRLKSHVHTRYPKTVEDEMLIILQEARITSCFVPAFVLKILARLVHKARSSPEINQAKGVSVRFGIHGLELLVGESERTRAISHKTLPVPRHSDMHCLSQIAKFELSEIDDTLENRQKIFSQLLDDAIKETSLEYVQEITPEELESIKLEFSGKTFQVSQKMVWQNGQTSYQNQLQGFATLATLIDSKIDQARKEQASLEQRLASEKIPGKNIQPSDTITNELKSAFLEIILDGLCHVTPKIIDKKEAGYVAA
ncbi:MAG: sigma 54-interacting transcriptional regulator [Candidatus Nitrosotenuis sp.]